MSALAEKVYEVAYDSNNSGGDWWLSDDDWRALEAAGWRVDWFARRDSQWFRPDEDGRWLGGLASSAVIEVKADSSAHAEAVAEMRWQEALGFRHDPNAEGCNCCGRPHSFYAREKDQANG